MNALEPFKSIKTFVFDVDGVFTNSDLIVLENGRLLRTMSVRDGYAVKRAVKEGFQVIIITGGTSSGVTIRLQSLGIEEVHAGVQNKLELFEELVERLELNLDQVLYMGDDLPDYHVMRKVGLPTCPADAVPEVRRLSRYISPSKRRGRLCTRCNRKGLEIA